MRELQAEPLTAVVAETADTIWTRPFPDDLRLLRAALLYADRVESTWLSFWVNLARRSGSTEVVHTLQIPDYAGAWGALADRLMPAPSPCRGHDSLGLPLRTRGSSPTIDRAALLLCAKTGGGLAHLSSSLQCVIRDREDAFLSGSVVRVDGLAMTRRFGIRH